MGSIESGDRGFELGSGATPEGATPEHVDSCRSTWGNSVKGPLRAIYDRSLLSCRNGVLVGMAGLALACATPVEAPKPVAELHSLRVSPAGSTVGAAGTHGGYAWLGIPYAVPPEGELRWRAPRPLPAWTGTHEALAMGSSCPQFSSSMGGDESAPPGTLVGSEDCLFLNVYTPAFAQSEVPTGGKRLPVMLWIHGGGNTIGTSNFYDGSRLANRENLVVVTVNYRLGPLGWFRQAGLREGLDAIEASGNFGTLDLILALEWVRTNVESFGGDPENITLFGESAGGWNVFSLLVSPLTQGSFHRAISQSGVTWSRTAAEAEHFADAPDPGWLKSSGEILLALLQKDRTASDRNDAKRILAGWNADKTARYLRGKSVSDLYAAYGNLSNVPMMFEDGTVLPAVPLARELENDNAVHRVPLMLGTNRNEERIFLFGDPDYVGWWFGVFPRLRDPHRYYRDAAYMTRVWKTVAVDDLARALAPERPGSVFAYRFDWDEEPRVLGVDLAQLLGASHGFEIPFVFGHWSLGSEGNQLFTPENLDGREALSSEMMAYWAQFARSGDPGSGRDGRGKRWTAWSPGDDLYAVLDTPADGGVTMARSTQSIDAVVRDILVDPSFTDTRERCRALSIVWAWADQKFTRDAYLETADGLCANFPLRPKFEPPPTNE